MRGTAAADLDLQARRAVASSGSTRHFVVRVGAFEIDLGQVWFLSDLRKVRSLAVRLGPTLNGEDGLSGALGMFAIRLQFR